MQDPKKYLPQYHQNNQAVQKTSGVEDCQVCCGNICMICAIPFGCFGCTDCCCCYILPTA
jgi:hypothetical protein